MLDKHLSEDLTVLFSELVLALLVHRGLVSSEGLDIARHEFFAEKSIHKLSERGMLIEFLWILLLVSLEESSTGRTSRSLSHVEDHLSEELLLLEGITEFSGLWKVLQ